MLISTLSRAPRSPARSSATATPTSLAAARWPCAATIARLLERGRRQAHDAERHVGRRAQRLLDRGLARRLLVGRRLRQLVGGDDLIVGGGVGVDRLGQLRAEVGERRAAAASAARSSSEPVRVFGRPATIISSDAPTADASAAADPPPGVGSEELKAVSRSRTDLSVSDMCVPERRHGGTDHTEERSDASPLRGCTHCRSVRAPLLRSPCDPVASCPQLPTTSRPRFTTARIVSAPTRIRSIAGPSTTTASICLPGSRLPTRS